MSSAQNENSENLAFSEDYHKANKWKTKISATRNPLLRALWNFCSFKRGGVNILASQLKNSQLVLDLGCGNGAYSCWFLGNKPRSRIIATDWSFTALQSITDLKKGPVQKVCADIHNLPFKPEMFDLIFSIDTFGHVSDLEKVLNETLRVAKKGANLFLHSECSDYRHRWPDRTLIRRNNKDILAEYDGHFSLKTSESIHSLYNQRFHIKSFFSPAGILGWIIGYPDKYYKGFKEARMHFFMCLTGIFTFIKRMPILGAALRFLNAFTNRVELYFGLYGGGSCFSFLEKPDN